MAQNPIPPQPAAVLTPTAFALKYRTLFAKNDEFKIDEVDLQVEAADIADLFLFWAQLGRTLLLDTEAELATVDQRTLVLNQLAYVGRTGLAPGATEVGEFILRPDSQGPLWAYRSHKSLTRVRARWLPIGDPTAQLDKFPVLQLDAHTYAAGDVVQHTFTNAQTLLLEVRRALPLAGAGTANPVPTGLATDPNYKPFAPLTAPQHAQNTDQGTNADLFEIGMTELVDATGEYYRGLLLNKSEGEGKGFLGAMVQDAAGQPCFELVQCRHYVRGGPNVFEPIGSGTSLPGLSNIVEYLVNGAPYEVPADGEVVITLPVGTLGVLPLVCLQPDPTDPTKGVSRPVFSYAYDKVTRQLVIPASANLKAGNWLRFHYYTAGAADAGGSGDPLESLTTTAAAYPNRQLVATMASGAEVRVNVARFGSLQAVTLRYSHVGPGKPYAYKKDVVYDLVEDRFLCRCLVDHESEVYPLVPGPYFEFVNIPTWDSLSDVYTEIHEVQQSIGLYLEASGAYHGRNDRGDGGQGSVTIGGAQSTAATGVSAVRLGGYKTAATGAGAVSLGGSFSQATGDDSFQIACNYSIAGAKLSGVINCVSVVIPPGFEQVVAIGLNNYDLTGQAVFTKTVLLPDVALPKPGTGITLLSPDGTKAFTLCVGNDGKLVGVDSVGSGTPSVSSSDIDYSTPVEHTASAVLTAAAFGKLHIINSNTPITLTLPDPAGNKGKRIAVQITAGSTALHTIALPNGVKMDARDFVKAWGGELREWVAQEFSYVKTNGRTRPMKAKIKVPATGQFVSTPPTKVQCSVIADNVGVGLVDIDNYQLIIPRSGEWSVGHSIAGFPPAQTYIESWCGFNGTFQSADAINANPPQTMRAGQISGTRVNEVRTLPEGTTVGLWGYVESGSMQLYYDTSYQYLFPSLYVQEINPY